MKKLLLLSFCYLFSSMTAQINLSGNNLLKVTDNFTNPPLWTAYPSPNAGMGTTSVIPATSAFSFVASISGWGSDQFCSKNITNFTGGGGVTPVQVPNTKWTMEFDYIPTSYYSKGTANLLMAMTSNGAQHPIQISSPQPNTFTTTNSDVIGVMLYSPVNDGLGSQIGIWVKDGNQAGSNVVYASSDKTLPGTLPSPNPYTTSSNIVGSMGTVATIQKGINVPINNQYRIKLTRAGENLTLTAFNGNTLLGTVMLVLPPIAATTLNVSPATGARFSGSNVPQAANRRLHATVKNLALSWGVNPFLSFGSGSLTPTMSLFNSNGNNIGYSYCLSTFVTNQVSISSPIFPGTPNYAWNLNSCNATSVYAATSSTSILFSGAPNPTPSIACLNVPQGLDYPAYINITNLQGNFAGNIFEVSGGAITRISTVINCRVATANTKNGDALIEHSFNISPNPATDHIQITIPQEVEMNKLSIYNLNGQVLIQKALDIQTKDIELDISHLSTGMYLLKVEGNSQSIIQKLIKN